MTCESVRDELALAALGEAEPVSPAVVDHLVLCSACRDAYRKYTATVRQLAEAAPRVDPPAHLKARVLSLIPAETAPSAVSYIGTDKSGGTEKGGGAEKSGAGTAQGAPRRDEGKARQEASAGGQRLRAFFSAPGWATAAVLLLALNGALWWNNARVNSELNELAEWNSLLQGELLETWRAFSSAPAELAGDIRFAQASGAQGSNVLAGGYLYQRPNGWAVLIYVEGISPDNTGYRVWLREGDEWTMSGPLWFDADGVGLYLMYARASEVTLQRVGIVPEGVTPGTTRWRQEAVVGDVMLNSSRPSASEAW